MTPSASKAADLSSIFLVGGAGEEPALRVSSVHGGV